MLKKIRDFLLVEDMEKITEKAPKKFLALDIEILKVIPDGCKDWNVYRPFGITCAATVTSDGRRLIWFRKLDDGGIASQMTPGGVAELVGYLQSEVESGTTIVTWNGLGFDFDVLAEESELHEVCKSLALGHIDMMFHLLCQKGYPLSLDKAAKGMGLPGKPSSINGALAAQYWAAGQKEDVLNYVLQDATTTLDLFLVTQKRGQLNWLSNRNIPQSLSLPKGWLTARDALELPLPDTSWMTTAWSRNQFVAWMAAPRRVPRPDTTDNARSRAIKEIKFPHTKAPRPLISDYRRVAAFFHYADGQPAIWNRVLGQRITHVFWGLGTILSFDIGQGTEQSRVKIKFDQQVETEIDGLTEIVVLGLRVFRDGIITHLDLPVDLENTLNEWLMSQIRQMEEARRKEEENQKMLALGRKSDMVDDSDDDRMFDFYEYEDDANEYERDQSDHIDEDNEDEYYEN